MLSYQGPVSVGVATWTEIVKQLAPEAGIALTVVDRPGGPRSAGPLRSLWRAGAAVGKVAVGARRHDVLHINACHSRLGLSFDAGVACLARAVGLPVVVHYRGSVPHMVSLLGGVGRVALRILWRAGVHHLAVTAGSWDLLSSLRPGRVTLLPNPVDPRWPNRSTGGDDRSPGSPVQIVCVGRASLEKGAAEVLAVAPTVDAQITFIGEVDPDAAALVASAPSNVACSGAVAHCEVLAMVRAADILVSASHREGFPYAILEGMAAGLPIVATDVGAVGEMVVDGRGGFVVERGDVDRLAASIQLLVADSELRRQMGEFNHRRCITIYSADGAIRALRDAWRSAIERHEP